MGKIAKVSTRKANGASQDRPSRMRAGNSISPRSSRPRDFMIRILQLQNFEAFYPYFESLKLSPLEYAILVAVRDNKTVTQSELAGILKMQLPNLVKILSRMEETGVLKRKRSTRDKRAVELSLSAAGERRADEASRLGERFNAHTLSALSKPEQTAFLQMLVRLVEAHKNGF